MRNPPLPPLPAPDEPPRGQRVTRQLWADWGDWADATPYAADAEVRSHYEDEAPARTVLTRPLRWTDELDAPTVSATRVSAPLTTSLMSGPLGALPSDLGLASPRRRIQRKEWALLATAIGIVVVLVAVVVSFGLFGLPGSSDAPSASSAEPAAPALPSATATLAPTATATVLPAVESSFASQDRSTQGNWQSHYGSAGYIVVGDTQQLPPSIQVTPANQQEGVWQNTTGDSRALQKASDPTDPTDRVAGYWYAGDNFTIDVNVTDGQTYQLALYFVDWDQQSRAEIVNILDPTTDAVLDTRSVTAFANGEYLVWNVRGHIVVEITNAPGSANAVVSGLFFAPAAATTPGAGATPGAIPGVTPDATPLATPNATPVDTSMPSPTTSPDATPTETPADTPSA